MRKGMGQLVQGGRVEGKEVITAAELVPTIGGVRESHHPIFFSFLRFLNLGYKIASI